MKERPILFSAPMIRAINAGRKTQTRRIVKLPKSMTPGTIEIDAHGVLVAIVTNTGCHAAIPCRYGRPGDRLWVRETWGNFLGDDHVLYRATNDPSIELVATWKPSIHMFRKDSRILLEVVSVRVERLQDISEADAIAEGASYHEAANHLSCGGWSHDGHYVHATARASFEKLWNSINSNRPTLPHNPDSKRYARVKRWLDTHPDTTSWDANPWVWVVEFRRVP